MFNFTFLYDWRLEYQKKTVSSLIKHGTNVVVDNSTKWGLLESTDDAGTCPIDRDENGENQRFGQFPYLVILG